MIEVGFTKRAPGLYEVEGESAPYRHFGRVYKTDGGWVAYNNEGRAFPAQKTRQKAAEQLMNARPPPAQNIKIILDTEA